MSIEFEGLEEVLDSLEEIIDVETTVEGMRKACALVERAAKEKAPKGSGDLRRSITSRVEDTGTKIEGTVYTPLEYAPYVEFGTGIFAEGGKGRQEVPWVYVEGSGNSKSHKKTVHTEESARAAVAYLQSKGLNAVLTYGREPQPFLRPALYENREEIKRALMGELTND
jgi:HK97 gp10 family phage protein